MGLLAKSTSGFGTLRVKGRSRVPNPPTRISAFILISKKCFSYTYFVPCIVKLTGSENDLIPNDTKNGIH